MIAIKRIFIVVILFWSFSLQAQEYSYTDTKQLSIIGKHFEILEDTSGKMTFGDVLVTKGFQLNKAEVPNFGITNSAFWLRCIVSNETQERDLFLNVQYPLVDHVLLYLVDSAGNYSVDTSGEMVPVSERKFTNHNFIFKLSIRPGHQKVVYLRVASQEQILVPLALGGYSAVFQAANRQDILTAVYFGIIFVMVFYNFFVFLSVREKSYLVYVAYIIFIGLTQIALQGYSYRFFWPSSPYFANQTVIWFPAITGILAIEFFKRFLHIGSYSKYFVWILNALNIFYGVNCFLSVAGYHQLSQQLMQPNAMLASLVILLISVYAIRKNNRSAKFFLFAWVVFLVGIVVFILKDLGKIPFNNFTNYILHIGSAIEVVVLSFALADKINIFRKEKEQSQAEALAALRENERIIREQNVMLENKVNERTIELKQSNEGLNKALVDLKEAETQLVESEKMASLGQLTAGIAHEINNPINFVTSNVKPLKRDVLIMIEAIEELEQVVRSGVPLAEKQKRIEEYKQEIDYDYLKIEIDQLLTGISEGAGRTAEIVKGLRIFSRLDEDDIKKADINEGLDSTLIITNNLLNNSIKVIKEYSNLPLIECYPGKLNQVFLNIISNGVYAVRKKFADKDGGKITIATKADEDYIYISIADNGIGMDENTKKRLYEPFFTTKDVGEGTGLGMSIAYNTIIKHNGYINIISELGEGTEFIIKLPLIQK
jgi:signal transduction histidine kinase